MKYKQTGFTLLEMLIGLSILGIIMVAFFKIVGSTADTSNDLTQRNDLIQDAQLAQQIVNARIQEACYIYPSGTVISMGGYSRQRSMGAGTPSNTWTVGTDPILAMLLPPDPSISAGTNSGKYRINLYYPVLRSTWTTGAARSQNPGADPGNANNWILVEYMQYVNYTTDTPAGVWVKGTTCAANATSSAAEVTSGTTFGRFLIDNVQPTDATGTYSQIFTINGTPPTSVTFRMKMQRALSGRQSANSAAVVRVPPSSTADPMQTTISPQNNGL